MDRKTMYSLKFPHYSWFWLLCSLDLHDLGHVLRCEIDIPETALARMCAGWDLSDAAALCPTSPNDKMLGSAAVDCLLLSWSVRCAQCCRLQPVTKVSISIDITAVSWREKEKTWRCRSCKYLVRCFIYQPVVCDIMLVVTVIALDYSGMSQQSRQKTIASRVRLWTYKEAENVSNRIEMVNYY